MQDRVYGEEVTLNEHKYYAILGVMPAATADEIRKAYKRLAVKLHPDKRKDVEAEEAAEEFKNLRRAYSTLGDQEKRQAYDAAVAKYADAGPLPPAPRAPGRSNSYRI